MNIDLLNKIIVNEAPLSSYVKSLGRGVQNVAKFGARTAGKAVGSLYDPYGGKARKVTEPIGSFLQNVGKQSPTKPAAQNTLKSELKQSQQQPLNYSKIKTSFVINGRQIQSKYLGNTKNNFPVFRIQGIPWAKSVVLEPKGKNKLSIYMYKDKIPNIKKQPSTIRTGTSTYSGVQNKLVITTK